MTFKLFVVIVSLVLVLLVGVGCTVGETAVSPTATAVLIVESVDTPTPSPTPQPTATSQPTAVPTSTPLPTATNTPTPVPTDTASPSPTDKATPSPTPEIRVMATSVSPQGNWVAISEEISSGSQITRILKVKNTSEQLEWVASTTRGGPMDITTPYPFSWSRDEQFFYFTHRGISDACQVYGNGHNMHRLNLLTGVTEEIVQKGYWFALSPDEKQLAYLSYSGELVIHDLGSNHELEVQFAIGAENERVDMQDLMWSPDSNNILTIAAFNICVSDSTYSLIRVNTTTLEQTVLIDKRGSLDQIISWPETARALLKLDYEEFAWVNTTTGELTPAEE